MCEQWDDGPAHRLQRVTRDEVRHEASESRRRRWTYTADHAVLSRSKQISPVLKCTLGWNILVANLTVGGARGYCEGTSISSLKYPKKGQINH
jgi:hypothetical protein